MEDKTMTIDIERYEELLDIETRVMVARDMTLRERYIKLTDLLCILGFKGDVDKIEKEEKERLRVHAESTGIENE